MPARLKVHVDPEKCQGQARCQALAPELFELDEFGNAHATGDGAVPAALAVAGLLSALESLPLQPDMTSSARRWTGWRRTCKPSSPASRPMRRPRRHARRPPDNVALKMLPAKPAGATHTPPAVPPGG